MLDLAVRGLAKIDSTLLRLRLIGTMEARALTGDSVLPVGGKTKSLLAILALSDRKPVARSRLAELLWSRRPDDLARASLRQEIHRLLDALSPLGVEIINVQRHALSLKPALTSVDAERILNGGISVLRDLPPPSEVLLGELNGIDGAFDEWLANQRDRLERHIRSLFESALRHQTDPEILLDVAEQLLQREELNEVAWRTRIQTLISTGERALAMNYAEQVVHLFQERLGTQPGPATMALVTGLQSRSPLKIDPALGHVGEASSAETVVPLHENAVSASGDVMLREPLSAMAVPGGAFPRRLGTLTIMPFSAAHNTGLQNVAAEMADMIEVGLQKLQMFTILPFPQNITEKSVDFWEDLRRAGNDYVVTGLLRQNSTPNAGAKGHLIVRVLDLRQEGSIVWADRFDLPENDVERKALFYTIRILMQWTLLVAEGQRLSMRPVKELSAPGLALRALVLLLRTDCTLIGEIQSLIGRAVELDGDLPLVLFVHALVRCKAAQELWVADYTAELSEAVGLATRCSSQLGENPLTMMLSVCLETTSEGLLTHAKAILAERRQKWGYDGASLHVGSPLTHWCLSMQALLSEDYETASAEMKLFRDARVDHPASALCEPSSILVLILCGNMREAEQAGAAFAGLYPRCTRGLFNYLLTLADRDAPEQEIASVRNQMLRLAPELSVARAMSHHAYLPAELQKKLSVLLSKTGLPNG
ncbi:BTAD domain-containing putative transcriptional regulator [Kozakia baliensis]|uniref:BTAD domain-containing putative transcriptional regulator n=1 Tax=Kozakia baliensis TaxID=153496 RepID=UPI00087CA089|nr:BTAD domain-containing putative transcriptional regulator [Kozakia baliensis]AOX20292.1 hypothetical protein A0U90_08285 [Kozakia baliensis]